ncbi:MAG: amino acid transporter [Bermanella sp.]|jgi:amino acid transporter
MNKSNPLKRTLGFPILTLYGLGTILGAGIYVLIGKVAATAGMFAPISFLLAAVLAGFSGYCYAALSSRFPQSAGEAAYIQAAFGIKNLSSLIGWMVILTGVVSAATISNGFVGYLNQFVSIPEFWAISIMLTAMCGLACWGVSESVTAAAIVTGIELAGLLMVLVLSGTSLAELPARAHELIPDISDGSIWFAILLGAFLAFYAFIGFEDMVNMAEEVKEPERTLPKAILTALAISSILYVLIALVAMMQLPLAILQQSTAPMADILKQHSAQAGVIISLISIVAVVNGALVQIIMGARVLYGMARQGLAPVIFGKVNNRFKTPVLATVLITIVVWVLAVALPLTTLAKITSFVIILVFLLVNVSLIKILSKEARILQNPIPIDTKAMPIKTWVPYVATLMCLLFLSVQVYQLIMESAISH